MPDSPSKGPVPATTTLRMTRIFTRFVLFVFVVFCIVALSIGYWLHRYCPPIRPERATPEVLTGWLIFRDFRSLDAETQERLLEKYLEYYGPGSTPVESGRVFKMMFGMAGKYTARRAEGVASWAKERRERSFFRKEYTIVPSAHDGKSDYIVSADVEPCESLRETVAGPDCPSVPDALTKAEGNCRVLTKCWFQTRMKKYDAAPDAEKIAFLKKTAVEMNWWQDYYNDYLTSLGLPRETELELLREFALMTTSWYRGTPPEELARLLWFKDLLVATIVLDRIGVEDIATRLPIARQHDGAKPFPAIRRLLNRSGGVEK